MLIDLFTKSLRERRAGSSRRDCDLQIAPPDHGREVKVAEWWVVNGIAQNAALVVPPLTLKVVGEERLAREALADTGLLTIGFD